MVDFSSFRPLFHGNIKYLLQEEQFCDVTLISKSEKYKVEAHKVVLSAASTFFNDMLNGSPRKASAKEVKLKEIKGKYLKPIITFIYTSSIKLTNRAVKDIIRAARVVQLLSLVDFCIDFMVQQLDSWNCIGVALFAKENQFQELEKAADKFICKNFMAVRDELYKLNYDHFYGYICTDDLCVPSEEEVFLSLLKWRDYDKESRKEFFEKGLRCVHFHLIPLDFLVKTIEPVWGSADREYLSLLKKFHGSSESRLCGIRHWRDYEKSIIAFVSLDTSESILHVALLHFGDKEWRYNNWPCRSNGRELFAFCTLKSTLNIAGGVLGSTVAIATVESFDLRSHRWSELPPMNVRRKGFGMVALNGELYAVGGLGSTQKTLRSVEKWKPPRSEWQPVTEMSCNLPYNFKVSAGCNVICVSAPNDYGYSFFNHSIYYPETNTWAENWLTTRGELLGTGLWRCSSITYLIVVFRDVIRRYNLENKSFTVISSVTIAGEDIRCMFVGDRLIVYGRTELQEYDLLENQWKLLPKLENLPDRFDLVPY